jgi:hypothetical protein
MEETQKTSEISVKRYTNIIKIRKSRAGYDNQIVLDLSKKEPFSYKGG